MTRTPAAEKETRAPGSIGSGGGSHNVTTDHGKTYAMPVIAGAVDMTEVMNSFFDNIPALLEEQLEKLPGKEKTQRNGRRQSSPQRKQQAGGRWTC